MATALARSELELSDRILVSLVDRRPIVDLRLDLFLLASVLGTWLSTEVAFWFHAVFLTAALLARRLPHRPSERPDPAQQAHSLAQIESAIGTGRALKQGVLGLIRTTDGHTGTDIRETRAAAVALAARALPRRVEVTIRQRGPEGRVPIRREQVHQIVLNLVMNAAEAIVGTGCDQ
ncbi:MAG: hypothetical protein GY745_00285, partial [Actinomycetia bacterium]|nr:hypothetical protein [Actinomycetes bacterium]